MGYLIRFSILLTALALISCNGADSDRDTPSEDTTIVSDSSSGSSYSIGGLKTMAVEYSTDFDMMIWAGPG